jgi:hypothetical protein
MIRQSELSCRRLFEAAKNGIMILHRERRYRNRYPGS